MAGDWTPVGVPGTADTAAITAAGTYTVGIAAGETIAVAGATLDSAGATLEVDGQFSASGSLELDAGTVLLTGTIADTTIVNNGATLTSNLGTFSNVTYEGTLDLGDDGNLLIANGLTVTGAGGVGPGVINVTGAGAAALVFTDTETLNDVTINIGNDTGFNMAVTNGDSLTLGTGVVVNSIGLNGFDLEGGGTIISEGTINAGVATGQATIGAAGFVNAGVLNVTGGQTLLVDGAAFSNTGSVYIDSASELDFDGTLIAATQTAGGSVDIEGTLNADGSTIDLGATSAFANTTLGGTLENAVIVSDGGTITYNGGTLLADTIEGTLDLGSSGVVTILDGLTVTGAGGVGPGVIDVTGAGAATLVFGDTETLDNLTLNIGNDTGFNMAVTNGDSLTLGTGVVVNSIGLDGFDLEGGGTIINEGTINAGVATGQATIGAAGFVNAGVLNVTGGQTLLVDGAAFSNTGSVYIDSASELDFDGTLIAATQTAGGSVDIEGTLNADGSTIDLGATSAFANTTLGGTLENAVIVSDGGTITYNGGTLLADTIEGTLDLGSSGVVTILDGLTVTGAGGVGPGVIDVTGAGAATLVFGDTETLDNLTLNIGNDTGFNMAVTNGDSLTLGTGVVVNSIGLNGFDLEGGGTIISEGTINAGVATGQATIGAAGFVNAGVLNVTGGQTLLVDGAAFSNTGSVYIDSASELDFDGTLIAATQTAGGSVDIEGTLNADGSTIDLGATSAFANTTLGGTLENAVIVSDGGTITYSIGTLVSSTVDGTLDLGSSGILLVAGGLTVNGAGGTGAGVIDVTGAGAATLVFTDAETLDNVTLNVGSNGGFDTVTANGSTLKLDATVVVNSLGLDGLQLDGPADVNNLGVINAAVVGGSASIDTGSFENAGTITVSNKQLMSITSESGTVTNTGLINVLTGGSLDVTSALSGTGRLYVGSNSTLEFGGAVGAGQALTLHGTQITVVVDAPANVAAKINGFVSSDRIDLLGIATLGSTVKAVGNTAVVTGASAPVTLTFAKPEAAGQAFGLVSDGRGGSDLITGRVINGATGGHATINAGVGNAIITAHGIDNTITASSCDAVINAGSGGAKVSVGPGNAVVNISGTLNHVTAGNGSDIVDGHASGSVISLGSGNDQVVLTGGLDAVTVGAGTDTISITGSVNAVKVGGGDDTITINGNYNAVSLTSGMASVSVTGTTDVVFLGSGATTVADTGKNLNVAASKGVGTAIISGVASDPKFVLDLLGGVGGYHTAAQAYAALTSDGNGGSLLALGTGSVDFAGVTASQLSAKNFAVVHTVHV